MTSEVGIYNLALGRIGVDRTVSAIGEASKEARVCNRAYAQCRDEVLEAQAWPFAVKALALAALPNAGKMPGWQYQYSRPSDALRILEITAGDTIGAAVNYWCSCSGPWQACRPRNGAYSFREALAPDGNSTVLLTDMEAAYVVYVARVGNAAVFPALVVSAIADRLAMEIAMPMTATPAIAQMALNRYNISFLQAATAALDQGKQEHGDHEPPSVRARR